MGTDMLDIQRATDQGTERRVGRLTLWVRRVDRLFTVVVSVLATKLETGFEPVTPCLPCTCSTTELLQRISACWRSRTPCP